jgi:hypothetical protein
LEEIYRILDSKPTITDIAYQDLTKGGNGNAVGAKGMTAERLVRAAIIKKMNGFSFEDLGFHIVDSSTFGGSAGSALQIRAQKRGFFDSDMLSSRCVMP